MATIEKALEIAARAHTGQRDKEGLPYILHPLRVMHRVEGEAAQIVAILHDVVEDTEVTFDDLRDAGFSDEVLAAVACVTHAPEDSYADYVARCASNPVARQVKLGDLQDNMSPARTMLRRDREERDLSRMRRYALAYKFLTGQLSQAEYLDWMRAAEPG